MKIFPSLRCILIFAAVSISYSFAQMPGWSYLRSFNVTENSGSTLIDYQIKLILDTQTEIAAGRMDSTGKDIRFGKDCPGNSQLNYWIEGPMNDPNTIIWVKLDSLPANSTKAFFMFYGNPGAVSNSAIPGTFNGPHSSTDSVASGGAGGVANSQRGFRFTAQQDVLVQSFGKRDPQGTMRYVTLFSYPAGTQLRQYQVSGPAAQYSYAALPSPIWLTPGNQYVLTLFQGVGDGYYFGTSSQIGQALTYGDMKYCNSCTQNTFPTNTLSNYHYGYPDFWYFTRNQTTPAPSYFWNSPSSMSLVATDEYACTLFQDTLFYTESGFNGTTSCFWSPASGLSDSTLCNPIANVTATSTYIISVIDSLGCFLSDSLTVFITPGINLNVIQTPANICQGDTAFLVANGADTYLWWPGAAVNDSTSDSIWALSPNNITLYITGTDTLSGCTDQDTIDLIVNPAPSVVFNINPVACLNDGAFVLNTGIPTGGLYSGPGVSAGIFDPGVSGTGFFVLDYFFVDSMGCSGSDTAALMVPLPTTVSYDADTFLCSNDEPLLLSGGNPPGGNYSGSGVSGGNFDPAIAGAGQHFVYYTFIDNFGCINIDSSLFTISLVPGVTFNIPSIFCIDDPSFVLNSGTPQGGIYSGAGVTGNSFDPSIAGLGSHILSYNFTDSLGCSGIDTANTEVIICVGIEKKKDETIVFWPNPNSGKFFLRLEENWSEAEFRVSSIFGQGILNAKFIHETEVDISGFPIGLYSLEVESADILRTVVIEKIE